METKWWRHQLKWSTFQELLDLLRDPLNGEFVYPIDSYNRVFERIFIGDQKIAANIPLLKSLDIRHVLNGAHGTDISLNMVNISPELYFRQNISFLGIKAIDLSSFDLLEYFDKSAQFIEDSLSTGGNVLVHCKEGISRSAALVLSYLMIKKGLTAPEAIRTVRKHREIRPNDGFLTQLGVLNDRLIDDKVSQNSNII